MMHSGRGNSTKLDINRGIGGQGVGGLGVILDVRGRCMDPSDDQAIVSYRMEPKCQSA